MPADSLKSLAESVIALSEKATPGPWAWNLNVASKHIYLESHGCGHRFEYVMDFARWGVNGATPRFRTEADLMENALCFCEPIVGCEHHARWCQTVRHPDADFIASTRSSAPALARAVLKLLQYVEHSGGCSSRSCLHNADGELESCPCDCGLAQALAEIEVQRG